MSARSINLLVVAWLGLTVFGGYQARVALRLQAQHDAFAPRAHQLDAEAAALRRDLAAVNQDLAQAEHQLADLTRPTASDASLTPARRGEVGSWLARVKRLRRLFDEKPGQHIPEMRLLTDDDWMRQARTASFETDDETRRALAGIRSLAIERFSQQIAAAIRKHAAATKGAMPSSLHVLADYFDSPADPTMLERYEIAGSPRSPSTSQQNWTVQNRAPIDLDYDQRAQVTANSWGGQSGPFAWLPGFSDRYRRAVRSYMSAHQGFLPNNRAEVVPFFSPPLEPEIAQRHFRPDDKK